MKLINSLITSIASNSGDKRSKLTIDSSVCDWYSCEACPRCTLRSRQKWGKPKLFNHSPGLIGHTLRMPVLLDTWTRTLKTMQMQIILHSYCTLLVFSLLLFVRILVDFLSLSLSLSLPSCYFSYLICSFTTCSQFKCAVNLLIYKS